MSLALIVDSLGEKFAKRTSWCVQTRFGKYFLLFSLVGPFTFIPTLKQALLAQDISALNTVTWPLMIIVNLSVLLDLVHHNGSWRLKLVMAAWVMVVTLLWAIILFRSYVF